MMMVMVMRVMKMIMVMVRMMMTLTDPFVSAKCHCKVDLCLAARSHLTSVVRIRMIMKVMMVIRLPTVTWHHWIRS